MTEKRQKRTIIAALGNNRVIGNNGKLPWHLPKDWAHFNKVTRGGAFLMGRKSYEADDRLLSENWNYILTSGNRIDLCGKCSVVRSVREFYDATADESEVFILGGEEVFRQTLQNGEIDKMILTIVNGSPKGDSHFPEVDWSLWVEQESLYFPKDDEHEYDFTIKTFEKKLKR